MLTRRQISLAMLGATLWLAVPAHAQRVISIERGSPERTAILDVVRASVERRLGIKVIFVVGRLTSYGDWAFADLHPRTASGERIDYRRTRIAKEFDPEQDSDIHGPLAAEGRRVGDCRGSVSADRRCLGRMGNDP